MHVPSLYLKGGQRALIKERQRVSKNDPSKLRQEAGTPDCVWFDVRGNTRITPQFNGALPYIHTFM